MNLMHLKYAVEVAKMSSISRAAESLFMGQPNLSRAIKELEDNLGIKIFQRTSKGITPTEKGEVFLKHARSILKQLEAIESLYRQEDGETRRFCICAPHAAYIGCAMEEFVKNLEPAEHWQIHYRETGAHETVSMLVNEECQLGIVRLASVNESYFGKMLLEKGLEAELVFEFEPVLVSAENGVLAQKEQVSPQELVPLTEVTLLDSWQPHFPDAHGRWEEADMLKSRVFVTGRAGFMSIAAMPQAYAWDAPSPARELERYGLAARRMPAAKEKMRDVLVYRKDYRMAAVDMKFIDALMKQVRGIR